MQQRKLREAVANEKLMRMIKFFQACNRVSLEVSTRKI